MKTEELKPELIYATSHEDERGSMYSITGGNHNEKSSNEIEHKLIFNHTKITKSLESVFRGFHSDDKSWKKCTCISGRAKAILINPDNTEYLTFDLREEDKQLLIIPPKWFNGYASLTNTIYAYCLAYEGEYIDAHEQMTIKPEESCYTMQRIIEDMGGNMPILSERDKMQKT